MKNQALFSSKDESKKLRCGLLQFLFGALRVKTFLAQKVNKRHLTGIDIYKVYELFDNHINDGNSWL